MSPAGGRQNGLAQQAFQNAAVANGKPPVRPRREDEGGLDGTDDGLDNGTQESYQTRAKSPAQQQGGTRAVSPPMAGGPATQAPNMIGVSMGINGRQSPAVMAATGGRASPMTGRASPVVERPRANGPNGIVNDNYQNQREGPNVSPTLNGFVRPSSRTGANGNGSAGNVAGDLVRDLKAKDVELDSVKRQMAWMKEALSKATKAGFVQTDREGGSDMGLGGADEGQDGKQAELALRFKQFKAQVQVSSIRGRVVFFCKCRVLIISCDRDSRPWQSKPSSRPSGCPKLNVPEQVQRKKQPTIVLKLRLWKSTMSLKSNVWNAYASQSSRTICRRS